MSPKTNLMSMFNAESSLITDLDLEMATHGEKHHSHGQSNCETCHFKSQGQKEANTPPKAAAWFFLMLHAVGF